ncbi:MAG: hypothetical protein KAQ83_00910 [Nanoarchaeota archaeon]|nr:hypothetical protein [Nanoarchaeota archaeon]
MNIKVNEFLSAARTAYCKVDIETKREEKLFAQEHASELEDRVVFLKKELAKYKAAEELEKKVLLKFDLDEEPIKRTEIIIVKIDKDEIKKLQLQIIRLGKICELLERNNKTKKLANIKIKLKKLEKKLKTIKGL